MRTPPRTKTPITPIPVVTPNGLISYPALGERIPKQSILFEGKEFANTFFRSLLFLFCIERSKKVVLGNFFNKSRSSLQKDILSFDEVGMKSVFPAARQILRLFIEQCGQNLLPKVFIVGKPSALTASKLKKKFYHGLLILIKKFTSATSNKFSTTAEA